MRRMGLGIVVLVAAGTPLGATRDGAAHYDLSIAGVPIGGASLAAHSGESGYTIEAAADFGFLFWGGAGTARVEGAMADGALTPRAYDLAYQGVTRPGRVAIQFEQGRAVRWSSEPPPRPEYLAERVDVTAAHLEGVLDPLSALVIPAAAISSPEAACRRVLPVFSGMTRFDVDLVGAARSHAGVVDCMARYRPVSGHRAGSPGVARLTAPGAISVSLAPLDSRFWGPSRITVATRFGTFEMVRR